MVKKLIKVVCFDIGGVLAHVCRTWAQALHHAGYPITPQSQIGLEEWPKLRSYQTGEQSEAEYLRDLATFFDVPLEAAIAVHDGILLGPTEGTLEMIQKLNDIPIVTACFSNTNDLHWKVLLDPAKYPNINILKFKYASHVIHSEKPHREAYAAIERKLGVSGNEILFFEDSPRNVEVALQCNWDAHLIDHSDNQAMQVKSVLVNRKILT